MTGKTSSIFQKLHPMNVHALKIWGRLSLVTQCAFLQASKDLVMLVEHLKVWRVAAVASLRVQVTSIIKNNFILNMEKHRVKQVHI